MDPAKLAYNNTSENRALLFKSDKCGCYECGEVFTPFIIDSWGCYKDDSCDDHPLDTAECPKCGYDSVVPVSKQYVLSPEFLADVKKYNDQKQKANPFSCAQNAWFVHGVTRESWAIKYNIQPFEYTCDCGTRYDTCEPFASGPLRGLMGPKCGCGREHRPYAVVSTEGSIL